MVPQDVVQGGSSRPDARPPDLSCSALLGVLVIPPAPWCRPLHPGDWEPGGSRKGFAGKRSVVPVSGRCGSRASIVEQRADPVRPTFLRRDIDRCWPSTTPASGWPGRMSIPGRANGYVADFADRL